MFYVVTHLAALMALGYLSLQCISESINLRNLIDINAQDWFVQIHGYYKGLKKAGVNQRS
jgi:hypothetical protein